MMYLYDGTFDGFLTCVYEHYYSEKADDICPPGAYQPDMLTESRRISTDEGKAEKVETAIRDKISPYALARAYRVFRTSTDAKEMMLLNYLRFCFKRGPGAAFLHSHPLVHPIVVAERKIGNEVHRLCGLIRFAEVSLSTMGENAAAPATTIIDDVTLSAQRETSAGFAPAQGNIATAPTPESNTTASAQKSDTSASAQESNTTASAPKNNTAESAPRDSTSASGHGRAVTPTLPARADSAKEILYARVSPDHEALEFLAPHFADRFKNEPFIIHDTRRGRAVFAWRRQWHIADFTEQDAAMLGDTAREEAYRSLWRNYFDTIAIKERTNPRCQRNLMPARYWENLPEMQLR